VGKSIARAGTYANPAPTMRHDDWLRNFAHLRRLAEMADRIRALERRLAELEGKT
jgi:UDP-3-O-[3-hydroxymyristoyl] glucosamine N-acyltransferase